jgi:hypothetical protein
MIVDRSTRTSFKPASGKYRIDGQVWMVDHSELIQFDGLSAFRPCGRDLPKFFQEHGTGVYVQVEVPMRLPYAARLPGSNLLQAGLGPM